MTMKRRLDRMLACRGIPGCKRIRSERGAVLVVVVILSAIALLFMTTLIYMITVGTQVTGMEKRYRTVHDAAFGGWEIMSQLLGTRGGNAAQTAFTSLYSNLTASVTTPGGCQATVAGLATPYTSLQAKLMAPSTSWVGCNQTISIDPKGDPSSYDLVMTLGASPSYNVYGKVVNTVTGNSGGDTSGLIGSGVVSSASGEVSVVPRPYLYTIEIDAENASNPAERAKLSILYQY